MIRKPNLTGDEIDEIVRLREEEKWPASRIAKVFNRTQSCINYQLLKNGVDPWDAEKHPIKQQQKGAFTPEEDARLLRLRTDKVSLQRIADIMVRPYTSVRIRIMTLEVRAETALERAA